MAVGHNYDLAVVGASFAGLSVASELRSPSFQNLSVLLELLRDCLIADCVAINGSLDLVMGCVDR